MGWYHTQTSGACNIRLSLPPMQCHSGIIGKGNEPVYCLQVLYSKMLPQERAHQDSWLGVPVTQALAPLSNNVVCVHKEGRYLHTTMPLQGFTRQVLPGYQNCPGYLISCIHYFTHLLRWQGSKWICGANLVNAPSQFNSYFHASMLCT